MAKPAARKAPSRYEADIPIEDYAGINTFGPHSALAREELRDCVNYDLIPGYLKSRRGSTNLQGTGQKFAAKDVLNAVTWKIGDNEYEIQQVLAGATTEFWWARILPTPTAHVQVQTLAAVDLATATADIADMKVSGNRLYIFHPSQNYIIEWSGTAFTARTAGLPRIGLTSLTATGSSSLRGKFTVGAELVYQVGGADIIAGSPNRKTAAGRRLDITVDGQDILVQLDSATFPGAGTPGDYWTHVRVWKSFNQNPDYSDPLNPVDPQGLPDELYPEVLISKADLILAGYQVTLTKADAEMPGDLTSEYPVLPFSMIELLPLPAARTGAYLRNRIWVDDSTGTAVLFSNTAGDAYAEQYNPLNVLREEKGDGQKIKKLMPFEEDLILLKEAKTLRVPAGDPDVGIQPVDTAIGISHLHLAHFVPKVGICAITNDQGDIRILGYDLRWTNILNGYDISRAIRTETAAMAAAPTYVSFAYGNGKLFVSDGTGDVYVLHVKEGKAWSRYSFPMNNFAQRLLTFANGSRMLVASRSTYLVEIEKDGLDTDINTASDAASAIALSHTYSMFQSRGGRDVLEMMHLSVIAKLSKNLRCIPFTHGHAWPEKTVETPVNFTPDVGTYAAGDSGLEREWQAHLEERMLGIYQHFRLETSAPATIRSTMWKGFIDEVGMGAGYFDPFVAISSAQATPDWADTDILDAGVGARNITEFDTYDAGNGPRDLSTMTTLSRG